MKACLNVVAPRTLKNWLGLAMATGPGSEAWRLV